MNRTIFRRVVAVSMVLFVLTFSVKGVTGQGPGPDQTSQPSAVIGIKAAVASRISYQGVLKEDGTPVTGSRNMIFRLHKNGTCTSQVGSDIVMNSVSVAEGLFSVTLDVTQSTFDGQALWLQVLVGGVSLSCREITATPYALSLRPGALISDTLSGPVLELFNNANAAGIQSLVGGGAETDIHPPFYPAAGEFAGLNGVIGAASDYASDGYGVIGLAQGTSGRGVFGRASAGSGTNYGGYFESYSTSGRGVYGSASVISGTNYGGYFVSSSTDGRGVYGAATATSGTTYGIYGRSNSSSGFSGFFTNTATYGVGIRSLVGSGAEADIHPFGWLDAAGEFAGPNGVIGAASAYASDGYGVIGIAQGINGRGVNGYASAASGTNYGGYFTSLSINGRGVYGVASPITGTNYGGYFESNSDSGTGVRGFADASTGTTYGVYGMADSPDGYGVLGTAPSYGVRGNATSTGANSYGVYGDSDSLSNTAAGGRFIAGSTATTSESDGALGLAYGQNTSAFGLAGWAYYQGVGVGAWSYSGNIMEGYDGDYPGGTRRMYLTQAGNLYIDGTYNTYAMAQDGSKQVLYGTQSTEVWVEDYGTATLADGLATVKIATDFAKTVSLSDDYHVFLTPMGDCALYVAEKTAVSFTVRAIDGKTCSIAFDYRIVAKQTGMESYRMTEIASPAEPAKTEPVPEDLPLAPPEPEPSQPVDGQSVP